MKRLGEQIAHAEGLLANQEFLSKAPAAVVERNRSRLVEMQNAITYEQNGTRVGMVESVLTEGPSRRDASIATTRSEGNRIVHVPGEFEPGGFMDVRITRAAPHYLEGTLL